MWVLRAKAAVFGLLCALGVISPANAERGLGVFEEPRFLGAEFDHYPAMNPDAPKGCTLRETSVGLFDSLNPWILKGRFAAGIYEHLYDGLLAPSLEEEMVGYGLIASDVAVSADGREAVFTIDERARFHDGHPIMAADVAFTVSTFREKARPYWQLMLKEVAVDVLSPRKVRVRVLADVPYPKMTLLEVGMMPVLPAHYWESRDFGKSTLEPFVGSGPYKIGKVVPGRRVTLERVTDYWAKDLPINRGRFNFDELTTEYFLDETAAFQAFLAGDTDRFVDRNPRRWATMYEGEGTENGQLHRMTLDAWWPLGMNGYFFNLRDPKYQDIRVRRALNLLFDFEWPNTYLFHGAYRRTESYFQNSAYAADKPPTEAEKEALAPFRDELPDGAFTSAFSPDFSDLDQRERFGRALALFKEAGWGYDEGVLKNNETGEPFVFRITTSSNRQEQILGTFFENLRRAGIRPSLEVLDGAAFEARMKERRFDVSYRFYVPPSVPGDEQARMWGSPDLTGSEKGNLIGLTSEAADHFLKKLTEADSHQQRIFYARLLDRVLQWGEYVIPTFHDPFVRVAYWDQLSPSPGQPSLGGGYDGWWCRKAAPPS